MGIVYNYKNRAHRLDPFSQSRPLPEKAKHQALTKLSQQRLQQLGLRIKRQPLHHGSGYIENSRISHF